MEILQAREAFLSHDSGVMLNTSNYVTTQLANITTGRELPLFPMDLQITNSLIHSVINMLEDNADVLQQSSATKPDVVCMYYFGNTNYNSEPISIVFFNNKC